MVRPALWISSISMGLLLGWQAPLALSQQPITAAERAAVNQSKERVADYNEPLDDDDAENGFIVNSADIETVRERYPSGTIKIEREVTQDAHGNYVNHGPWKMFDPKGNLMAQGEYDHGSRTGEWIRWYRSINEAEMLSKPPYQQFQGPFISQATFDNDQMHGMWIVYDGKKHKISQINFVEGQRDGVATWWYLSGRKMREIQYKAGDLDGPYSEWNGDGQVTVKDTYEGGRRLGQKTVNHKDGGKKSEGMFLYAKELEQTPDDWWNFKFAKYIKTGKDEKHGPWSAWHTNGQKQLEGNYDHDIQVGKFVWWHANGQKSLEGHYVDGKQDGEWIWWYDTGQKSIRGEYVVGNPTGRWTWWKEDGKVTQSADLSHAEGVVIDTPKSLDSNQMPRASKPLPKQSISR